MPHIQLHVSEETILHKLCIGTQGNIPVIAVSDGSAGNEKMSYGWVLATVIREQLACGSGLMFGHSTSYHAEAHGVLAALSFVRMILHCATAPSNTVINSICDNQGLIKVLEQH